MSELHDFLKAAMSPQPTVPADHVCPPLPQGTACSVCGGITLAPGWSAAINAMPEEERKAFREEFGIVEVKVAPSPPPYPEHWRGDFDRG